jgi:VanZ family protein
MIASPRALRLAFWTVLAATFVVAIWPAPLRLPGEPSDKMQHILAFASLAALAIAAYRAASPLSIVAGLALFGALIELTQAIPALNRDADLLDWIADVAAVSAVVVVAAGWRRIRQS